MITIDRDQAGVLAALVAALRPDWDEPGILKALSDARTRGDAYRLAHAALYAAEDVRNRTPAIIALTGEHWTRGRELGTGDTNYARCIEPGHTSYAADNCGACRADRMVSTHRAERDDEPVKPNDVYSRGARIARAALANHTHTQEDR